MRGAFQTKATLVLVAAVTVVPGVMRAEGLCDIRFRMLGGEEKTPLAGLELTVNVAGRDLTATTEKDGGATFQLAGGSYKLSFTSPRALPYLRFERMNYEYRRSRFRTIHVNDTPTKQTLDVVLADPCELVLRAVDVDTGRGIPGVGFAMENLAGEVWADPVVDDTVMPASKGGKPSEVNEFDVTDEQGYLRRLVGPRHKKWTYFVNPCPDGYRLVFGSAKIDTSLGKKKAEQTFLLRSKDRGPTEVSIYGHVRGIDGELASGHRVTALPQAWISRSEQRTTMTDKNGWFILGNLPDGPCNVSVTSDSATNQPNMQIRNVSVKKGSPVYVRLSLRRKNHLRSRVTNEAGEPQSNRNVMPQGIPDTARRGREPKITAPEGWDVVQPRIAMLQAEFALPKAEGDERNGRLTVMRAGGSIEANIQRWRGQFEELEDKPVEEIDVSGIKVTLVDFSGTYREQRGIMGPVAERPGYRMSAAIISTPEGLLFVKGYGPAKTMARHGDTFRTFVESLALSGEKE